MAIKRVSKNPSKVKRNYTIAEFRCQGLSCKEIGDKVGLTKGRISQILKDDEIKDLIDQTHRIYAAHAKGIAKEFLKLCYDKDKNIKLSAIKNYQKIMGFLPAHLQNQFITQINIKNESDTPEEMQELKEFLEYKRAQDIKKEQEKWDAEGDIKDNEN